ncbi:hypothetical protein AD40_5273 [Escherichia coli 1-392-07_S4_C3]|uniref:Uncharacterized protein n=1 Tax=Shigella dysenteriae 1 TaxID=984897 RepID=A0A142CP50_SHIDY|nr:hypothetical protein [Shigella dysenteriae 1]KEN83005.1 hypothetical protein AD40_5273 [Escherichia coli 1-392-07_S4_C3]UMW93438.1 hypothetical protein [Escherichia coli]CCE21143.1 hypothetical protein HUS41_pI0124 [Escherichia coli]
MSGYDLRMAGINKITFPRLCVKVNVGESVYILPYGETDRTGNR